MFSMFSTTKTMKSALYGGYVQSTNADDIDNPCGDMHLSPSLWLNPLYKLIDEVPL